MLISSPSAVLVRLVCRLRRPVLGSKVVRSLSSRLLVALLGAGALALACGPHVASTESEANAETPSNVQPNDGTPLATSLDVSVHENVTFTLHVTNTSGKRVELTFPSGQTHEFVVLDSIGREVWRWSNGRLFTQAIQNKLLTSKESAKYEETWDPSKAAGKFTAVARLNSSNYPIEERVEFTLP